jgi:hypothetical protein
MNTDLRAWRAIMRLSVLCVILVAAFGCSKENKKPQPKSLSPTAVQIAEFARRNNCVVLEDVVDNLGLTNHIFSYDIQTALASNPRLVASGYLTDVVRAGDHIQAIFEVFGIWEPDCVLTLDCPTNTLASLRHGKLDLLYFAFEPTKNKSELIWRRSEPADESEVPVSRLIVQGKLISFAEF